MKEEGVETYTSSVDVFEVAPGEFYATVEIKAGPFTSSIKACEWMEQQQWGRKDVVVQAPTVKVYGGGK